MKNHVEDIFTSNDDYIAITQLLVNEYGKFEALNKALEYKFNNELNKQNALLVDQTLQGLDRLCQI